MKTKVLFYCTKGGNFKLSPYKTTAGLNGFRYANLVYDGIGNEKILNGKIVCECEVECRMLEVEMYKDEPLYSEDGCRQAIKVVATEQLEWDYTLDECDRIECYSNEDYFSEEEEKENYFLKHSCLTGKQLQEYVNGFRTMYALNISNLKVFDEPLELKMVKSKVDEYTDYGWEIHSLKQAPQNMQWCYLNNEKYCLISIRPEWLCKILNGEKTIEVRKKILKGMM